MHFLQRRAAECVVKQGVITDINHLPVRTRTTIRTRNIPKKSPIRKNTEEGA